MARKHYLIAAVVILALAAALYLAQPQPPIAARGTTHLTGLTVSGAFTASSTSALNDTVTLGAGKKLLPSAATGAGTVFTMIGAPTYLYTTSTSIGILPANVDILDIDVTVTAAFNDSGTDQLSCGYTLATPTEYINAADVSSTGVIRMGGAATIPVTNSGDIGSSNRTVYCKYVGQNSNASAGAARVVITYAVN